MERRVLENANEVVVVSPGMAKDFQHIVDREYQIITNGFDGEVQSGNPPSAKKFTLMHIGSLVPARNPENLWKSLGMLVKENTGFAAHLEIRLIGQTDISVKEAIAKEGLDGYTSFIPFIPHNQAIEKLSSASLLLLIINNTPNANLILTGKIFEYLQSGRPVLCIGPSTGDAARIITQTRTGKCVEYADIAAIRDTLLEFYDLFKKEALVIRPENIAMYTRKNLTARLAEVLDGMVH
jgi:glycosyltransferase involved in cell wall biosynthesis